MSGASTGGMVIASTGGTASGPAADGRPFAEVPVTWSAWVQTWELDQAGKEQQEYFIVKMNDVIITGVVHGGSGEGSSETVSLVFAKVDFEYRPQKIDGTLDDADLPLTPICSSVSSSSLLVTPSSLASS